MISCGMDYTYQFDWIDGNWNETTITADWNLMNDRNSVKLSPRWNRYNVDDSITQIMHKLWIIQINVKFSFTFDYKRFVIRFLVIILELKRNMNFD